MMLESQSRAILQSIPTTSEVQSPESPRTGPVVAAHQPNYMPDPIVLFKGHLADVFVLADDTQFSTRSITNRCRIRGADGVHWLTVPVRTSGRGNQLIRDVHIDGDQAWWRRHLRTLASCYRHAPYFEYFEQEIGGIYGRRFRYLLDLNLAFIEFLQRRMGLSTEVRLSSELDVRGDGSHRLVSILEALGAGSYLVEEESLKFVPAEQLVSRDVRVLNVHFRMPNYHQQYGEFIPGLSAMDMVVNEGPESGLLLARANALAKRTVRP